MWVVGTDHAGIATQMVVERNLESQGIKRAEIGREAFLEHVWEWKAQSGGAITRQLRRLGASLRLGATSASPWTRASQKAVINVFVELYKRGLLYRDKRLVNWDPKFQTAISDLEVETREVQGKFWHFNYPLAAVDYTTSSGRDGNVAQEERDSISIATTRPETMLADMAVAVHPEDERYTADHRQAAASIPITGSRLIPIIADEHADPELRIGRGEDHAGPRLQRLCEVQRKAPMYRLIKARRHAQHVRCAARSVVQTRDGLIPQ